MNKKHLVYFCSSNFWLQPTPMHVPLFCPCVHVFLFGHPCLLAQTLAGTHVRSVAFGHGRIFVSELWQCFSGNALRSSPFLKESRWCSTLTAAGPSYQAPHVWLLRSAGVWYGIRCRPQFIQRMFFYTDGSGSFHTQHQLLTTSLVFDMVWDAVRLFCPWWFSTLERQLFDYFAAVWYGVRWCPQFLQMMVFYTDSSGSYHSERQLFDYFAARKKTLWQLPDAELFLDIRPFFALCK